MKRVMWIESKAEGLAGPARIGWIEVKEKGKRFEYQIKSFGLYVDKATKLTILIWKRKKSTGSLAAEKMGKMPSTIQM